jgi:hypothetical protein
MKLVMYIMPSETIWIIYTAKHSFSCTTTRAYQIVVLHTLYFVHEPKKESISQSNLQARVIWTRVFEHNTQFLLT